MKQKSANMLLYNSLAPTTHPSADDPEPAQREIREDTDEFKGLMEETRLRVLKAYKISFWRQYVNAYIIMGFRLRFIYNIIDF